jgi:Mor family transcriptional regulator
VLQGKESKMREIDKGEVRNNDQPTRSFKPTPDQAELNEELSRMVEVVDGVIPGKGKAVVVELCREYCGSHVYFIQHQNMFRKARDNWIIEQYSQGLRVSEIARRVNISVRQIWTILGR